MRRLGWPQRDHDCISVLHVLRSEPMQSIVDHSCLTWLSTHNFSKKATHELSFSFLYVSVKRFICERQSEERIILKLQWRLLSIQNTFLEYCSFLMCRQFLLHSKYFLRVSIQNIFSKEEPLYQSSGEHRIATQQWQKKKMISSYSSLNPSLGGRGSCLLECDGGSYSAAPPAMLQLELPCKPIQPFHVGLLSDPSATKQHRLHVLLIQHLFSCLQQYLHIRRARIAVHVHTTSPHAWRVRLPCLPQSMNEGNHLSNLRWIS